MSSRDLLGERSALARRGLRRPMPELIASPPERARLRMIHEEPSRRDDGEATVCDISGPQSAANAAAANVSRSRYYACSTVTPTNRMVPPLNFPGVLSSHRSSRHNLVVVVDSRRSDRFVVLTGLLVRQRRIENPYSRLVGQECCRVERWPICRSFAENFDSASSPSDQIAAGREMALNICHQPTAGTVVLR